ncbi:axonemal dynein light chain domain-containing protein 1-like [Littorina saxatilis]|uniref:Axonemal dynein light chain domain-containing protein 1 n=1 Tax=Littorina saxatilis TaxID=31220 RepID=A0AAN9AYF3_9CAEN
MAQAFAEKSISGSDTALMMQTALDNTVPLKLPQLRGTMEIDRSKPLPTSLQSDFIPDDVLFALTQPPIPRDKLGPPSRVRNLATSIALGRAPPANLWSHKRRDKFKHLLDTTACSCGAGKDISFLYDVPQEFSHPEKPDVDKSSVRKDSEIPPKKALQLPDTLVPAEYHIVKNKGVMGIEYHEDKYTTCPEDHEKHLIVFPSMKPSSRYEVVQLKKTMGDMLDKVGFNELTDIKGPTQMHNLLELIKKEQNIYNIVFHELIRQTSVECAERGELLADLRNHYSMLLGRVPQQIMSLHEEVMAQRALDRRLTDELMRFKNTISILTSELSDVKEHDKIVTREAQKTQEDLRQALAEAQKNAALLSEYHDLYELQRRRLEHQVYVLSEEREIWSTAAYSLALKVTEECRLTTAKRLHISEKAWAKLANHFTILLSDRDTDLLTQVQNHVERWRDGIDDFNIALRQREEEMKDALKSMRGGVIKWIDDFQRHCFNEDGHLVKPPDKEKMVELQNDFRAWEKILSKEAEFFGGDLLLSKQDELAQIRKEMEGWTDNALKVFSRHRGTTGATHADKKAMLALNEEVDKLLEQYQHRITGENGVAAIVIQMTNVVESWEARIISALNGTLPIQDSDWSAFYQSLDDWVASLDQAQQYVGTTQAEEERREGKPHVSMDIHQVVRKTQKWATTASNSIDSEDAKLVEQVSTLHSEMVRWMVHTLLRLAPDKEGNSQEASEMALLGSVSVPQLHENAKQLFQSLHTFSNYVTLCCDGIVMENTQKRQDTNEDNADHELKDLHRLRTENEDWIHTAQILMSQLTGESIEELFPQRASTTLSKASQPPDTPAAGGTVTYRDHEKLESTADNVDAPGTPADGEQSVEVPQTPRELTSAPPTQEGKEGEAGGEESSAAQDEGVPETSAEAADQPMPALQVEEADAKPDKGERMEILGGDENTHLAGLQDPARQELVTTPVKTVGAPDTKKAFEALAAVNSLQDQLIMTEQRAQIAEERAMAAESELAETQEMVRSLQKQMEKLTLGAEASTVSSAIPRVTPTVATPSQALDSPRQPSSADGSKGDGKKRDKERTKSSAKPKKKAT